MFGYKPILLFWIPERTLNVWPNTKILISNFQIRCVGINTKRFWITTWFKGFKWCWPNVFHDRHFTVMSGTYWKVCSCGELRSPLDTAKTGSATVGCLLATWLMRQDGPTERVGIMLVNCLWTLHSVRQPFGSSIISNHLYVSSSESQIFVRQLFWTSIICTSNVRKASKLQEINIMNCTGS